MNTIQVTDKFKIYCTNEIEKWRAETFWTKEPETIEWIENFYSPQPFIFLDIGANIGIYSLFCQSLYGGQSILSFEPVRDNYVRLCENIRLNNFNDIMPLSIALSHRKGYGRFYYQDDFKIGQTAILKQGDFNNGKSDFILFQTLDDLLLNRLYENYTSNIYIKIDIDGGERNVLDGMKNILDISNIQSVLIEINDHREDIIGMMCYKGFTTDNRFNKLENHSRVRRAKEGIMAENVIFTRK